MLPLAELLQPLTREAVYRALLSFAAELGLTTTAWQDGEPPKALLVIFSQWIAATYNVAILPIVRALFLDFAEGTLLKIVALTLYGVQWKAATFATGKVTLENRGLVPHTFQPDDVAIKNTAGKVFRNKTGGFLAAWSGSGDYPTLELDFEAVESGSESTTGASGLVAEPAQAPPDVFVVPNISPLIGQDEESPEALRRRCRLRAGLFSPGGPRAAYEYVALSTRIPDGSEASRPTLEERLLVSRETDVATAVTRVRVLSTAGEVDVYLASASGAAVGDETTEGTDVFLVNQAIQLLCVPHGITARVYAATEVSVTRTLEVLVLREANATAEEVKASVEAAVAKWFAELPIGGRRAVAGGDGYVLMGELEGVAKAAHPAAYLVTASPGTDVTLAPGAVGVPAITVNVTLVTQA